jgi:hypothetical protein
MVTRGWLIMLIGIALVAGGLVGLCFPVLLDSYDSWGFQVKCGNGYHAELVQATTDDQQSTAGAIRPATNYVHRCKSALAHRRAWLIPVAAVGALIFIPELAAWSRAGSPSSARTTNEWSEDPIDALHQAALLDRRIARAGHDPQTRRCDVSDQGNEAHMPAVRLRNPARQLARSCIRWPRSVRAGGDAVRTGRDRRIAMAVRAAAPTSHHGRAGEDSAIAQARGA